VVALIEKLVAGVSCRKKKKEPSREKKKRSEQRREKLAVAPPDMNGRLVGTLATCGGAGGGKPVVMTVDGWNSRERGKEKW